jgi:hypothetical protein
MTLDEQLIECDEFHGLSPLTRDCRIQWELGMVSTLFNYRYLFLASIALEVQDNFVDELLW